jgi:hypothetical protein
MARASNSGSNMRMTASTGLRVGGKLFGLALVLKDASGLAA